MQIDHDGRTAIVTGGSRGIGRAVARELVGAGARVLITGRKRPALAATARSSTSRRSAPRLRGTIHAAAERIRAAGGRVVPVVGDVRSDETIERAVRAAVDEFGGVDICVNNASVLDLSGTTRLAPRRYDLMPAVNTRGTFMLTRACLPELVRAEDPHVLTLSPPLNLAPRWLGAYPGYMLAKYGMTLATLGFAAEFADVPVAANCLWPRTTVATDAVANLLGGDSALARTRTPKIMADAAHVILTAPAAALTGQTLIDEDVLRGAGVSDLDAYATVPGTRDLEPDFFL